MTNTNFTIDLSYGAFDDDLCWEAKVRGTNIVMYSSDNVQLLIDIVKEVNEKYPKDIFVPSATLNDVDFFDISAVEELDLIRLSVKPNQVY